MADCPGVLVFCVSRLTQQYSGALLLWRSMTSGNENLTM